jgi:Fatty acid desaturase
VACAYRLGAHEAVRSDGRRQRPTGAYSAIHRVLPLLMTATFCKRRRLASASCWGVLTSRNVRGGWLTDLALGALDYQIEHHLFPSMPRPSLRRSQALAVRAGPGAYFQKSIASFRLRM